MSTPNILFDRDGLIYKVENDGSLGYGDSCAETMRYIHLLFARKFFGISNVGLTHDGLTEPSRVTDLVRLIEHFSAGLGLYKRAPSHLLPLSWGSPIEDFSRDQHEPLLYVLGHLPRTLSLYWEAKSTLRGRCFFFQNNDLPPPNLLNIFRRCEDKKPWALFDLGLWPTVMARCGYLPKYKEQEKKWVLKDPNDVGDDLNLIHHFLACEMRGHTVVSRRALEFYKKNRARVLSILSAVHLYYEKDNPGIFEVYRPILERVFR